MRVAWEKLMAFGYGELKLAPQVFWDLTPFELMILAGRAGGAGALGKSGLEALMRRFPDHKTEDVHGGI